MADFMANPESATEEALRTRIAELEELLTASGRSDAAHKLAETLARTSLVYTESIVDTVREPMLVLDGGLRVQTASRSFYQTFGVTQQATEGRLIYELGNGQWNIPALRLLLEQVLPQEKSFRDFEVSHDFPHLGPRVMHLNASKIWRPGNNSTLVLLSIEDVTERKRTLEELVWSNQDLESYATVVAHDLRSPLNSATAMTQLLLRRLQDANASENAALADLVVQNLIRLAALLQDILSFSQVSKGTQSRTLVNFRETLDIALANLEHHIREAGATVEVGDLPDIEVDRTLMVMVLQNLIGNAIKYRRGVPPIVRINAQKRGEEWHASVSDNGEGFDPQYSQSIFEPFKRLHGTSVPGSGIGLATCRRIIERFGGRIWADSSLGQGSTFHFTLPLHFSEARA